MLQDLTSVMATAERLAERIAHLCGRGEAADTELADLGRAVSALVANHPHGLPAPLADRCRLLLERVNATLAVADCQKAELADELEALSASRRLRHAYLRPPT